MDDVEGASGARLICFMGNQTPPVQADGLCNCDVIIKPIDKPSEPTYLPV